MERVELRDLLGFAGIAPPSIPVISIAQHLAEKLHAYVRDSRGPDGTLLATHSSTSTG